MKKIERIEIECTFTPLEMLTVYNSLVYIRHRLTKHPGCGARCVNLEEVERLIEQIKE